MRNFFPSLKACGQLAVFLLVGACAPEVAVEPAYVRIPGMVLDPVESSLNGSRSSKITTVWVQLPDGSFAGTFSLPCSFPVLLDEGFHTIKLYPGVNTNGMASFRSQYEFYTPVSVGAEFTPGRETVLKSPGDTAVWTRYQDGVVVDVLEDFEGAGFGFEPVSTSDTFWVRTFQPGLVFPAPTNENNSTSGLVRLGPDGAWFEAWSADRFELPKGGDNVYLELNYKTTVPFVVGVYAYRNSGIEQKPTATVLPKDSWNKIYINLMTEVSGTPDAESFKIFIGSKKIDANGKTDTILLDNIKLVYRP
jgi:hypothetical protein